MAEFLIAAVFSFLAMFTARVVLDASGVDLYMVQMIALFGMYGMLRNS